MNHGRGVEIFSIKVTFLLPCVNLFILKIKHCVPHSKKIPALINIFMVHLLFVRT